MQTMMAYNKCINFETVFTTKEIKSNSVRIFFLKYDVFEPEEVFSFLLEEEIEVFNSFKSSKRQREYAATRYLRTSLFGKQKINYFSHGTPFINGVGHISISHASSYVAIGVCDEFSIGIDLELIRPKVLIVSKRFLNDKEKQELNSNDIEEMTKVWSLKEALYKIADRNKIIFSRDLHVDKKNNTDWEGIICNQNHRPQKSVSLRALVEDNIVISFNTEAAKNV